ncbi:MAG: tetratricopeptide repeat protein [Bdellovibrionales bacterium]|nr:tetratricopeptide repeat protein [Bdellovibrionales bacterium]
MNRNWSLFSLALGSLASVTAYAGDVDVRVAPKKAPVLTGEAAIQQEALDRSVDQVALSAQKMALARMQTLLKKYRGGDQEASLLARVAEAWQQQAAIQFRIAHGRAHKGGGAVKLDGFNASMKSSVQALDELISRFKDYPDLHEAYYLRAKAYDELNQKNEAIRDYGHLVEAFPGSNYASPAHMRLAEYAIDDNQHEVAIKHLEEVEKKTNDPQFPFALYKLAWSHYNLGHHQKGLNYLERHVAYYRAYGIAEGSSEAAMLETSLMDISLFYYDAFEKKKADFAALDALNYFRKVEKGELLGKMISRYARLLRAGNFGRELDQWKQLILAKEMNRPESLEVVMALFEDRLNKRDYASLGDSAADLIRIYDQAPTIRQSEPFNKARATLLETVETIRGLTLKNKKATEVPRLAASLAQLSLAFTRMVAPTDERIPKVRFNLAEAFFEIGDLEQATQHYRWVVTNWKDQKTYDASDAALRAISTRYEVLRKANLIPTQLTARASNVKPKDLPAGLTEWMNWVDEFKARGFKQTAAYWNFEFELDRALYAADSIRLANDRLLVLAEAHPESEFAVPSASLVVDTAVADGAWAQSYALAQRLTKVKAWNGTPFTEKLAKIEVDSFYKMTEAALAAKDFEKSAAMAKQCVKHYEKSERVADCRLILAKTALGLNQREEATKEFNRIIASTPDSPAADVALANRAKMSESAHDYKGAAHDYLTILQKGQVKDLALRERVLMLSWLTEDKADFMPIYARKELCGGELTAMLASACNRLAALQWLDDPQLAAQTLAKDSKELPDNLNWEVVQKMPSENRSLWALATLKWNAKLGFKDRAALLEILADNWDRLEATAQFAALPSLSETVRSTLQKNREWMVKESPVRAEKVSIRKRLNRIQESESAAMKLVKLPWARVKAEVLNETAEAYMNLSEQLRTIPAPKELPAAELENYQRTLADLAIPFEEKAQDIRRKAYDLALGRRIEFESFDRIASVFLRDNPSQAKKLAPNGELVKNAPSLDLARLQEFDFEGQWAAKSIDESKADLQLRRMWWKAVQSQRFAAAAWYLREARESKLFKEPVLNLMRAVTLGQAGSRGEGLALLDEVKAAVAVPVVATNAPQKKGVQQ